MPGSSTLDPSVFLDSLIPIVDDIRRDIKEGLGFRPYRVTLVRLAPTTHRSGPTYPTACTETVLDPAPSVMLWKERNSMRSKLEHCGIEEAGIVKLEEVSLTYTEEELGGCSFPNGNELYYKLDGYHGQSICTRFFTLDRPPYAERTCCPGWHIWLRAAADPRCL